MRNKLGWLLSLIVLVLIWNQFRSVADSRKDDDTIGYQGQRIRLIKKYDSYEDYKDDRNNIHPSENEHVKQLAETAPIAKTFANENEVFEAVGKIRFPGYGMASFGEKPLPDGTTIDAFAVEVPRAHKTRYFIFRDTKDACYLLDDFTRDEVPTPYSLNVAEAQLEFFDLGGKLVFARDLKVK